MTTASSAGTPLTLSVLALVVSLVVGIGAVLMARANVQRQIQVAAREAWMREFREQVAVFFSSFIVFRGYVTIHATLDPEEDKRRTELNEAMLIPYNTIRLLIAERGTQYAAFVPAMTRMLEAAPSEAAAPVRELYTAAEDILLSERAAIETDPGVWRALRSGLGLGGSLAAGP